MEPEGQILLERCLLLPRDATRRGVFADWLQEHDEPELSEAIRGERGDELLCITRELANRLERFPSVKFLWGVVMVWVAEKDRIEADYHRQVEEMRGRGQIAVLPDGFMTIAPERRRGFFGRLFGR